MTRLAEILPTWFITILIWVLQAYLWATRIKSHVIFLIVAFVVVGLALSRVFPEFDKNPDKDSLAAPWVLITGAIYAAYLYASFKWHRWRTRRRRDKLRIGEGAKNAADAIGENHSENAG